MTSEIACHKEAVTSVVLSSDTRLIASVGRDAVLKIHNTVSATRERSFTLSTLPLSSVIILPNTNTVIAASWDSTL
jgi:WD40 repeat protein